MLKKSLSVEKLIKRHRSEFSWIHCILSRSIRTAERWKRLNLTQKRRTFFKKLPKNCKNGQQTNCETTFTCIKKTKKQHSLHFSPLVYQVFFFLSHILSDFCFYPVSAWTRDYSLSQSCTKRVERVRSKQKMYIV